MKKTFKVIFIYLGVLILALLATIVFYGGFLFFYRDGNIFGFSYVNSKQIIYAEVEEGLTNLDYIEVESGSYDVIVRVNDNVDKLSGAMRNEIFGYVYKRGAQASFDAKYNSDTNTVKFVAKESKGWINKSK